MSSFSDEGDGVYSRYGFREFGIPALKLRAIVDGGFLFCPFFAYKRMIKKYL